MKKLTDWAGNTSWGFVEGFPLTGDNCAKACISFKNTW